MRPSSSPACCFASVASERPPGVPPRPDCALPEMPVRSNCSSRLAIFQPAPGSPTSCSFGTRTLSKNTWQKFDLPEISGIGRVEMPGLDMSISRKEMPPCFESGSVRTRQKIQSARSA